MGPIEKSTLDWYIDSATGGRAKEAKEERKSSVPWGGILGAAGLAGAGYLAYKYRGVPRTKIPTTTSADGLLDDAAARLKKAPKGGAGEGGRAAAAPTPDSPAPAPASPAPTASAGSKKTPPADDAEKAAKAERSAAWAKTDTARQGEFDAYYAAIKKHRPRKVTTKGPARVPKADPPRSTITVFKGKSKYGPGVSWTPRTQTRIYSRPQVSRVVPERLAGGYKIKNKGRLKGESFESRYSPAAKHLRAVGVSPSSIKTKKDYHLVEEKLTALDAKLKESGSGWISNEGGPQKMKDMVRTSDWYSKLSSLMSDRVKEAKGGHWRKAGQGEDQSGNPIRGKTWVDTDESTMTPGAWAAMGLLGAGVAAAVLRRRADIADEMATARRSRDAARAGGGGPSGGGGEGKRQGWPFSERPNPPKAPRPQQSWHDQKYADDMKFDDEFYDNHGRGRTEDEFWDWMNGKSNTTWGPKARDAAAKARAQARAEGKAWGDSHRQSQAWHDKRYRTEINEDDAFYAKHGKGKSEKDFWESINKSTDPRWQAGPEARNRQAKQRADQGGWWWGDAHKSPGGSSGYSGSYSGRSSYSGYGGSSSSSGSSGGSSGKSSSSSDPWDAWRPKGSAAHESVLKSWGVDAAGISKKKEIKRIYQGKAMDIHPDKHPGKEAEFTKKMQDLNAEWEKVEKSAWYEKLARLRQMRLRGR